MAAELQPGSSWEGVTTLAPALRVLVACGRAVIDPRHLPGFRTTLAACADVEVLCNAAIRQGMLGHLHRLAGTLEGDEVGAVLTARLADLQRLSARRSLRQTAHLLRVVERLHTAGVEVMPYKGPAWGQRLYGDVTLRSWTDLDLLVSHQHALRARDVLLADGFVDATAFNAKILSRKLGGLGEVALSASDQAVHVELHWEITVGSGSRSLQAEDLFARAGSLRLLERDVLTPSGVDCLLITCINGAKDRWDHVEALLGLAVQLPVFTPAAWEQALAGAAEAGCARRVAVGVAHTCRVFGLETPPEVAEHLGRDAVACALFRSLAPDTLNRGTPTGSRRELAMKFWRFATEDSLAVGLRHGAVRFFRPGPEDWEGFALSPRMAWLYYPLRPIRLGVKWAKRLFRSDRGPT